ncbi:MAG: mannose-1-phosphate guanylyltransferase/mannose-6-phosphate isomerase [Desulfobacterales bacterium]|uniref:mannose-1-phosphate guanylyltransferase n=1 Tax=Candidatus Desulfatibia vada TaxID=2841696 RepID=A0A8J6TRC9_9BACT|nr:mannose-1-phosphate guanylyltransferase/mannose-6-phosphate isomerase [Candidatus Desulfatibia vada]
MMEDLTNVYPVLLAGGSGTRLWPVSRELYPKQLVKFIGDESLIQSTIGRLTPVLATENIRIVCGQEHFYEIARHMEEIGIASNEKIISEPCGRNTAPAILLAMLLILKQEEDAVLCIFPADHVIRNIDAFHAKLRSAIKLAKMDYIVTFGITPHYPETGYGYIEGTGKLPEQAFALKRFVEKPDLKTAKYYLESGNFFWNSGMFAFKASVMIGELETHHPELLKKMQQLDLTAKGVSLESYEQLPNISIDYAVMEKTDKGAVLPSDFGWSDIGSWKSLYDFLPKDAGGNVIDGDVITNDTQNCFILGYERLIATNSIQNMVVVETPDSVFVSDIETSRDVKSIVASLKEKGRREYQKHKTVHHPWGTFTVLEIQDDFRISKLIVYPGSALQIKTDAWAAKQLFVLKGQVKTTLENQDKLLNKGQSVDLSANQAAVLENPGTEPLIMIEIKLTV